MPEEEPTGRGAPRRDGGLRPAPRGSPVLSATLRMPAFSKSRALLAMGLRAGAAAARASGSRLPAEARPLCLVLAKPPAASGPAPMPARLSFSLAPALWPFAAAEALAQRRPGDDLSCQCLQDGGGGATVSPVGLMSVSTGCRNAAEGVTMVGTLVAVADVIFGRMEDGNANAEEAVSDTSLSNFRSLARRVASLGETTSAKSAPASLKAAVMGKTSGARPLHEPEVLSTPSAAKQPTTEGQRDPDATGLSSTLEASVPMDTLCICALRSILALSVMLPRGAAPLASARSQASAQLLLGTSAVLLPLPPPLPSAHGTCGVAPLEVLASALAASSTLSRELASPRLGRESCADVAPSEGGASSAWAKIVALGAHSSSDADGR
mmetsp:Transcript_90148/g.291726  ORF Transcript_90148/g.291726 Transcript_90148/m.291726 type:complete len:381 (-) Transcript_90148:2054-3196(-)